MQQMNITVLLSGVKLQDLGTIAALQNSVSCFCENGMDDGKLYPADGQCFENLERWGFRVLVGKNAASLMFLSWELVSVRGTPDVCGAAVALAVMNRLDPILFSRIMGTLYDTEAIERQAKWAVALDGWRRAASR